MQLINPFVKSVAFAAAILATAALAQEQPNIIVILTDDQGYGDASCYGADLLDTPNIDRLASEGALFTDAHAPSAVCQPSRYAVLAGRYNWRRGKPWDGQLVFEESEMTLPLLLQQAGYNTAAIGKWHLGLGRGPIDYNGKLAPGPLEIGFDYFFGTPRTHNEPPFVFVENHYVVGLDPDDPIEIIPSEEARERGLPDWGWGSSIGAEAAHAAFPRERLDLVFADKAIDYINQQSAEKPFFLYLAFLAPHVPNDPAPEFKGSSGVGDYGDVIEQMDHALGEVMAALEDSGLAENTLVFFTSDNGAVYLRDAIDAGHRPNAELLGQKTDAWEGGNRVPFIVRWPGRVPAGVTSDTLITLNDIMETSAAAAGVELPQGAGPDSINQLSVLRNPVNAAAVRNEFVYTGIFGKGLREGDWVFYPFQGSGGMTAHPEIRWGQPYAAMGMENSDLDDSGRLLPGAPPAQLYNVERDRAQTQNIYTGYPDRAERMRQRLSGIIGKPVTIEAENAEREGVYLLVRYGFQSMPTETRTDADIVEPGVTASTVGEAPNAEVDGEPSLSNFKGASLFIKRNSLDIDLGNGNNTIRFELGPDREGESLLLSSLKLGFGIIQETGGAFGMRATVTSGGRTVQREVGFGMASLADSFYSIELGNVRVDEIVTVELEFGNADPVTLGPDYSLRIDKVEVFGELVPSHG